MATVADAGDHPVINDTEEEEEGRSGSSEEYDPPATGWQFLGGGSLLHSPSITLSTSWVPALPRGTDL